MLHGRVSPGVDIKMKSVYSTLSYTLACDWPCGLAWPSTQPGTRACGWPCNPSQDVPPIFTRLVTQACLLVV
ncbi:Uncharacterized protein F383_21755 [Gossypium arboreum]|uniref:Uncharacterized protein n=1 Tax=Gossypium arboreum TaxID=29729 RepID=A0A0B0NY09_GOSAR|nr:Uncharacterized protein F383_21755 [Gossypium arboreum]